MPYKDHTTRVLKGRAYAATYRGRLKERKPEGQCTTCFRQADDPAFKKCSTCREYMRQYKLDHRTRPKREGKCSVPDCPRDARDGKKMCQHCIDLALAQLKTPITKATNKKSRARVSDEALDAYGRSCACCGNANAKILTMDHIDGYVTGPRGGTQLRAWLKANSYPLGYRTLCFTCNFVLAHHGYCPHSNLTQRRRVGRHPLSADGDQAAFKRREVNARLKATALLHYAEDLVCARCPEKHLECLTLDHINDDGAEHRRFEKQAKNLYVWLRQRGYPSGYQVLCFNCNYLKHLERA